MSHKSPGQITYEAFYGTYKGDEARHKVLDWSELEQPIVSMWESAARAAMTLDALTPHAPDLQELVTEILDNFAPSSHGRLASVGSAVYAKWRERASRRDVKPAPSPHLECTVCASGVPSHGEPWAGSGYAALGTTTATPGQAAYETACRLQVEGLIGLPSVPYQRLDGLEQAAWEDIAQAGATVARTYDNPSVAIAAQEPHAADELEELPEQVWERRTQAAGTAPELAAAMAETRQLRAALHTLADLWDASSGKDEESAARPNRARLVLEERATTRRNCSADIRKLAGRKP